MFDIFFLSYSEENADNNFQDLLNRFPYIQRVSNVRGIDTAHRMCAKRSRTKFFYVVDAETEVSDTFNFDFIPPEPGTFVWYSRNPVNDLEYGWGGIKLFHTQTVLTSPIVEWVDFTTSLSCGFFVIKETVSVSHFNTSPFATWKAAFRECAKLASSIIRDSNLEENKQRLEIWCSKGQDRPFGQYSLLGANSGKQYGLNATKQELKQINDFVWLQEKFNLESSNLIINKVATEETDECPPTKTM